MRLDRLIRKLGSVGFADVYLAEHIYLNTLAAVKLLNANLASWDIQNFHNEARTIAKLAHHHIVTVLDFGIEESIPYLVMEYAPDGTLCDLTISLSSPRPIGHIPIGPNGILIFTEGTL